MLNNKLTQQKKEKSIEQMFDQKSKSIQKMAERKLNSIEISNLTNNAVLLVTTFPDTWRAKLNDVQKCAILLADLKDDSFNHPLELLDKLKHGGIMSVSDDNRQYKEDYSEEPFKN